MPQCLNCQSEIILSEKYCSSCGQKTKISALSIFSIVKDFLSNLFNVENKIWSTLRDIWIPGKLSLAYIEGKRAQYYNPIRIFLIVLFTFFTVTLLKINEGIQSLNEFSTAQEENVWAENLITKYDSLVQNRFVFEDSTAFKVALFTENSNNALLDSIELDSESSEELEKVGENNNTEDLDSINIIVDSLKESQSAKFNLDLNSKDGLKIDGSDGMLFQNIPTADLYKLSLPELKAKHGKGNKYYELGLEQLQKIFKDFSGSLQFLISNGTWAIIAIILLLSLSFKLMYIRHNYLYAEHFIFHLYGHTRMLLLLLLISIISSIIGSGIITSILNWALFISAPIYLYLCMKRFYFQAPSKMKLKFVFTLFIIYPLIISICMLLITLLSFVFI